MGRISMAVTAASLVLALAGCRAQAAEAPAQTGDRATADLQQKTARFAVTDLSADLSALPANEREALAHMVRAAQVIDGVSLGHGSVSSIGSRAGAGPAGHGHCWAA